MSSSIRKASSKVFTASPSNSIENLSKQPSAFVSNPSNEKITYGTDVHDPHFKMLKPEIDKISERSLGEKIKIFYIIYQIHSKLTKNKIINKSEYINKLNSLNIPNLQSDVVIDEILHFAPRRRSNWFNNEDYPTSIKKILKGLCGDALKNIEKTVCEHESIVSLIFERESCKSAEINPQAVEDKSVLDIIFSLSNEEIVPKNFKASISLHIVLWMNNKEEAFNLISKRDDARKMSKNLAGQTLLHLAVKRRHPKIVHWLMPSRLPKQMYDKDENNKTPFDYAMEAGHTEIIFPFLRNMSHDEINDFNQSNKILAFQNIGTECIKTLNQVYPWSEENLNTQDINGQTPLHRILANNKLYFDYDKAELLFSKMSTATLNAKDKDGKTAFYYAIVKAKDIKIAKFLLSKLTDEEANAQCQMAFDHLMSQIFVFKFTRQEYYVIHIKLIFPRVPKDILKNYIPKLNIDYFNFIENSTLIFDKVEEIQSNPVQSINPDDLLNDSITASEESDLTLPSRKIHHELLNIIHSYAEINSLQDALRYLKIRGFIACEETFLSIITHADSLTYQETKDILIFIFKLFKSEKINSRDKNGQTILHLAVNLPDYGQSWMGKIAQLPIFKTLEPASTNGESKNEKTVLHLSSEQPHIKIIEFFISKMSNEAINAKDIRGKTALYYAVENMNIEITKLLIPKIPAKEVNDQCEIIFSLLSNKCEYIYRPRPPYQQEKCIKLAKLILSSVPKNTLENYKRILYAPFINYNHKYGILYLIIDFFKNSTLIFGKVEEIQSHLLCPINKDDLLNGSITASENYTEINSLQDAIRHLKIRGYIPCEDAFLNLIFEAPHDQMKEKLPSLMTNPYLSNETIERIPEKS